MIPFEIITMLGSGLLSGILSVWGMSLKARKEEEKMKLQLLVQKDLSFKEAREYRNKGFEFTRRTIALSCIFAMIVLPAIMATFGDVSITYGWTEFKPGFLFIKGKEVLKWHTVTGGFVMTPLHTHLVSAIIGLYFGSSITKNN